MNNRRFPKIRKLDQTFNTEYKSASGYILQYLFAEAPARLLHTTFKHTHNTGQSNVIRCTPSVTTKCNWE